MKEQRKLSSISSATGEYLIVDLEIKSELN